ncbi:MAG: cupin domain-containing protein [Alphaproteobacteria bacterium]|nr:cupin domain-containing protein [Alphaproteobacteria bacterium]
MNDDVMERLREVRRAHGLSQRELARRSGVANATISLIESGKTNPSVGALKRVLAGIPMDLGTFFSFELTGSGSAFYRAEDLVEIGKGPVSYRLVAASRPGKAVQILHEHYQPGADSGRVLLTHEGEEGAVVLRGRLEVTVGKETRTLGPGEAYYFNSNIPHRFRNTGGEVCELVSACSPPSF